MITLRIHIFLTVSTGLRPDDVFVAFWVDAEGC